VHLWQGWTWLQRGELDEAEASLRQAIDESVLASERDGAGLAYASAFLARVLIERGDLEGAAAALERSRGTSPFSDGDALLRRSRIELLLAGGDWARALEESESYRDRARAIDNPGWAPWRLLEATARDRLGQRDAAVALLEAELDAARRWGAAGALSATLRRLGEVRGGDEGLELLEEAVAVAAQSPAVLEHAKALIALGSSMRRLRRRSAAREPLLQGFELAGRCGADALAEHARTELRATGARPRREALSGPGSLTPSERRVAELAAGGESNRAIAQALYVTTKTVEVHLSSTYRKLGIARRAELPDALGSGAAAG
jgi:ATP/maltotriose-dependent transcriptional regulator MalT